MRSLVFVALFSVVASAQFKVPAPADLKAPPADAQKTASGLVYKVMTPGKGAHPGAGEIVLVEYTAWTPDGEVYETSVGRGVQTIPLGTRSKGWIEALQLMVPGETSHFWMPAAIAYKNPAGKTGMLEYEMFFIGSQPNTKPGSVK